MNFDVSIFPEVAAFIQKIVAMRPTTTFNPVDALRFQAAKKPDDARADSPFLAPRLWWNGEARLTWFHAYCQENGIKGMVETAISNCRSLGDVISPSSANPNSIYMLELVATICMNGEVVSKAVASQTFALNNQLERDSACNTLRWNAIGAALAQVGFGTVGGFELPFDPATGEVLTSPNANPASTNVIPTAPVAGNSAPAKGKNKPATTPAKPTASTVQMPDCFFGAASYNDADNTSPAPVYGGDTVNEATDQPVSVSDSLEEAWNTVWPGVGAQQGKTLREIWNSHPTNGPANVKAISEKRTRADKPALAAVIAAAKVIMDAQM